MKDPILKQVAIADIGWLKTNNFSRDSLGFYKDQADLIGVALQLATDIGWDPAKIVELYEGVDDAFINAMNIERAKELATFEGMTEDMKVTVSPGKVVTISAADLTEAYHGLYYTQSGKPRKPKYDGIVAFRRSGAFPLANAIRKKVGLQPLEYVQALVRDGSFQDDRAIICTRENESTDAGRKVLTNCDLLRACTAIIDSPAEGSTESKLGATGMKRGRAQKFSEIYQACALVKRVKSFDAYAYLMANEGHIAGLSQGNLRKIRDPKGETSYTEADKAEAYLTLLKDPNKGEKPRSAASRKSIEDTMAKCEVAAVHDALKTCAEGRSADALGLNKYAKELNFVYNTLRNGDVDHPIIKAIRKEIADAEAKEFATTDA